MRKKDNKRKNGDVNLILFSHVNALGSGNTINTGSSKNEPGDTAAIIEKTSAEEQSGQERPKPSGRFRTFLFNVFSHFHFFSDNSFGGKDEESQENGSASESIPGEAGGTTVKIGLASDAHILSDNKININIGARKKYLKELADNMDKRFDELERTYPEKVVDAFVTKFEEDIIPKFVEIKDETGKKITEMKTTIKEWHDKSDIKINEILNEVATVVAGQKAQKEDLKELLKQKEKQDEINRRLDLYMTSTEKTIAENTAQLKKIEEMLQLKEEQDRENFDAIKKGIKGLAGDNEEIKGTIGGLLKEETAFQEFQKLWDHNNYIKQQNDDIKQQNDYIKTLLIKLANQVYTQDQDKKTKAEEDIKGAIDNLKEEMRSQLNDSIKNAIAESDAKLLGMIMPEIANLKDKNDQILINQDTQTTILNSILSGQRDDALQYVAMSEKLDNLTELVSALGTRMQNQSFDDNKVVELLENFATSQEAMFAAAFEKVAKKEDLKRIDTGIDSIINMLSDNSITLEMMNESIKSMVSQINVMAIDIKRVLEILSQTRTELGTVADCDRCHSAKSMFYKCQVCGYNGESTNIATPNTGQNQYKREIQWWNEDRKILTPILSKIHVKNAAGESEIKYFIYISDVDASNRSNKIISAGMKYNNDDVETIIFEACDLRNSGKVLDCQTKEGCNIEEIFIELNRPLSGYDKNNIWEYFPNLKTISFAKPMDDKRKYVLGTKLLYMEKLVESKKKLLDEMKFYGGRYINGMENLVCYLEEKDGKTFLDVILDKTGKLHEIISNNSDAKGGKGYWRKKIESTNKEEK